MQFLECFIDSVECMRIDAFNGSMFDSKNSAFTAEEHGTIQMFYLHGT